MSDRAEALADQVQQLATENAALIEAARAGVDCADDLEQELNHRYMAEDGTVPVEFSFRYNRDMSTVKTFRAKLTALPEGMLDATDS
jgi:hypothetical protein